MKPYRIRYAGCQNISLLLRSSNREVLVKQLPIMFVPSVTKEEVGYVLKSIEIVASAVSEMQKADADDTHVSDAKAARNRTS